jgi:hypothetical protein
VVFDFNYARLAPWSCARPQRPSLIAQFVNYKWGKKPAEGGLEDAKRAALLRIKEDPAILTWREQHAPHLHNPRVVVDAYDEAIGNKPIRGRRRSSHRDEHTSPSAPMTVRTYDEILGDIDGYLKQPADVRPQRAVQQSIEHLINRLKQQGKDAILKTGMTEALILAVHEGNEAVIVRTFGNLHDVLATERLVEPRSKPAEGQKVSEAPRGHDDLVAKIDAEGESPKEVEVKVPNHFWDDLFHDKENGPSHIASTVAKALLESEEPPIEAYDRAEAVFKEGLRLIKEWRPKQILEEKAATRKAKRAARRSP